MKITALDHLVLTVADVAASVRFYTEILGMEEITFGEGRKALRFGNQKINLHQRGAEVLPNAQHAACGTADLCLLTDTPLEEVLADFANSVENITQLLAAILRGASPVSISRAILCVMTRVLPEPAPASTRHGPCV